MKNQIYKLIVTGAALACSVFLLAARSQADTTEINFSFPVPSPQNVTISAGDTVRWTGPSSFHPLEQVTGADSDTAVTSGFASTSSPFSVVFQNPGTFYYRCTNHGVAANAGTMRGSITVTAASATASPEPTKSETPTSGCSSKPNAPSLTSPTKGESVSKARVVLSWEQVECATLYRVDVRAGKKSAAIVDQKTTSKSSYKTIKLESKKTFFWSVKACNTKGCSKASTSSFSRP